MRSLCLLKRNSSNSGINDWRCIDFENENLEELYLTYKKLTKIESNSFQHLNKLKRLNLHSNQIEQIDSNGFKGLDYLE